MPQHHHRCCNKHSISIPKATRSTSTRSRSRSGSGSRTRGPTGIDTNRMKASPPNSPPTHAMSAQHAVRGGIIARGGCGQISREVGRKSFTGGGCDRGDLSRSRVWRAFELSSMGVCQSCSLRRSSMRSGSCCAVLRLVWKGADGGRRWEIGE